MSPAFRCGRTRERVGLGARRRSFRHREAAGLSRAELACRTCLAHIGADSSWILGYHFQSERITRIRFLILRCAVFLPSLRFCSSERPTKKVTIISAIVAAFNFVRSAFMFFASNRFRCPKLIATISCASGGTTASSRIELIAKQPVCPSGQSSTTWRKRSTFPQPSGSLVNSSLP